VFGQKYATMELNKVFAEARSCVSFQSWKFPSLTLACKLLKLLRNFEFAVVNPTES
jgi:hypothetical protein